MLICPACSRRFSNDFDQCSEDGAKLVQDTTQPVFPPGAQLEGGVVIQQCLGAGPTGELYLADRSGRQVMVKLLSTPLAADQAFCKQFSRLLGHLGKVQHPVVAGVQSPSLAFHQGRPWFVREPVYGLNLSGLVRRNGPLPIPRAVPIAQRIAEGLTEAHRAGALHLNLKPSNVFINENDLPKLVDFGLGQPLKLETKIVHGDPRFLAPEQFEGQLVSFRSDIYGVGALLFFMLTGRPPYSGNGADAARSVLSHPVPIPSTVESALAGMTKLDQVVMRALEKTPAKRYLSVQHFGRMMDSILQETSGVVQLSAPGVAPPASRTIPLSSQPGLAPAAPSPYPAQQHPYQPAAAQSPVMNDTIRMKLPPEAPEADLEMPTLRDFTPDGGPAAPTVETPMSMAQIPAPPPPDHRQQENFGTLRMAVPPAPQPPADTQPMAAPRIAEPQPPPPPSPPAAPGSDPSLDIVVEPPAPKKRKRRKKKKRAPVVAVRGEAALRLGPSETPAGEGRPGEAVMLDHNFMEEARGPERNLQTMEIRVRPEHMNIEPTDTPKRKKKSSLGKWALAAVALIILFIIAAVGAAALARWLSPTQEDLPSQSAPIEPSAAPLDE